MSRSLLVLLLALSGCFINDDTLSGVADADGDGLCIEGWTSPQCPLDCAPEDPSSGALRAYFPDSDEDGQGDAAEVSPVLGCEAPGVAWALQQSDCNDSDATVFTGAEELCDGQLNDCGGAALPPNETDADGDGFVSCTLDDNGWDGTTTLLGDSDCDDTTASVFPGAPEQCNEIDDNCDGTVDEDVVYADWYTDQDGDGHGAEDAEPYNDCVRPNNSADNRLDCDDVNATIYSGATELCDGLINNCDSTALPADELDADGDGFVGCTLDVDGWHGTTPPAGGGDCDDAQPTTYPGADEYCDGLLNNCASDGIPEEEKDDDGDGYVECEFVPQPWQNDAVIGGLDCNDDPHPASGGAVSNPGQPEICGDGLDNDCVPDNCNSSAPAFASGSIQTLRDLWFEPGTQRLDSVTFAGSGSPQAAAVGTYTGSALYVMHPGALQNSGAVTTTTDNVQTFSNGSVFGRSVSGDPRSNTLLVWESEYGQNRQGAGWVVDLALATAVGPEVDVPDATSAGFTLGITGNDNQSRQNGNQVWSDFDGNGVLDLVHTDLGIERFYVVYDAESLPTEILTIDEVASSTSRLAVSTTNSSTQSPQIAVGDLLGDGADELVIRGGNTGTVVVLEGGTGQTGSMTLSDLGEVRIHLSDGDNDIAIPVIGDFDGDGDADLAVGGPDAGKLLIFPQDLEPEQSPYDGSETDTLTITDSPFSRFGWALSAGDLNCDGLDDLVVTDILAGTKKGKVYIWFGERPLSWSSPDITIEGAAGGDRFGIATAIGDADGDACDDLLVVADGGGTGWGSAGDDLGKLYLIRGRNASE